MESVVFDRTLLQVLREVDIGVVLLVVEHDLIVEDDLVALLAILVPWLDLEHYSGGDWRVGQLQPHARFVFLCTFLRQLNELTTGLVQKLNVDTIVDVLASLLRE